MEQLFPDSEEKPEAKRPRILEFYHRLRQSGRCLHTIGWRDPDKKTQRIYCLRPVTQAWFIYVHSSQEWHAICATCGNHDEYDIVGIRDRKAHPEDPRNHAIATPYPSWGDWTTEKLMAFTEEWRKTHE